MSNQTYRAKQFLSLTAHSIYRSKGHPLTISRYRSRDFVSQRLKRDGRLDLYGERVTLKDLSKADFVDGQKLSQRLAAPMLALLKTDVQAWNSWISEWNNSSLFDINLDGADLAGANLAGANLHFVDLNGANLAGADLTGANLDDVGLESANLAGANLAGASLYNVGLSGANLDGADLTGANLDDVGLFNANLAGAFFEDASIRNVSLVGANLAGASFRNAFLDNLHLATHELEVLLSASCFTGLRVGNECYVKTGWKEPVNIGRLLNDLAKIEQLSLF